MFDAFTKVVAQADAQGQFISTSEIDALALPWPTTSVWMP